MEHTPLPPILNPNDPLRPYTPPPKPKKSYWQAMKKPLWISGLVLAFGFSFLVIIAAVMEEKVGVLLVKEVNRQLKTKLTVKDFNLSLISNFPNASADLDGVFLNDAFGKHLLKARQLSLRFSLFNLFKDNIAINKILIKDGVIVLQTDSRGRHNYEIVKPTDPKQPSAGLNLSIDKAQLVNMRIIYQDKIAKQEAAITLKNALATGNFTAKQFTVKSKADVQVAHYISAGKKFLVNKPLSYEGTIAVDMSRNLYKFDKWAINAASIPLSLNGVVQIIPQGTSMNLNLQNQKGNLSNLLQLLPPQYAAYFKDFQSNGDFAFSTTIKGISNKTQTPEIQAIIRFKNGKIISPKVKEPFTNVAFDATFNNKKKVLEVSNCSGIFAGSPVQARLKLVNFDDPSVDFAANGSLPLNLAFGLLDNKAITEGTGRVNCRNLKINGRVRDMNNMKALRASGELTFENASLKVKGEPVAANGTLTFDNNHLNLQQFRVKGLGTNAVLTGSFANWLPVLLSESTDETDLVFDARLDIDRLDAHRIVNLTKPKPIPMVPQSYYYAAKGLPIPKYRKQYSILNKLSGHFVTTVKEFNYDKINGRNFKGDLDFIGNDIKLRGYANAMGGGWKLAGIMALDFRPKLTANLVTDKISVAEFFRQSQNFGQNVLTSKNLSGKLNSRMVINAYWDESLNFLMDKLHVLADINVTDGELVNFKMLESFSNYIKIQDLKHVRFTNLNNQFEVYKKTIHIPAMFVQSNALNLQIGGDHTFDNAFSYNLVVNAGQVLMNRFKLFNPRLDPQPDQRISGWFNLYYNIGGNFENYKYKMDKSGVKEAFTTSEQQRQMIKQALDKSFGGVAIETSGSALTPTLIEHNNFRNNPTDKHNDIKNNGNNNIFNSLFQPRQQTPVKKPDKKKKEEDDYIPGF